MKEKLTSRRLHSEPTDSIHKTSIAIQTKPQKRPREEYELPHLGAALERPSKRSRVAFWAANKHHWPSKEQTTEDMDRFQTIAQEALARRRSTPSLRRKHSDSSSIAESTQTRTGSDKQSREQKSAPYKHRLFESRLRECGSYMDDHPEGITIQSEKLCQKLLKSKQTPPKHSLFSDDVIFRKTLRRLRGENETKVIREIMEEIVPSAERLADKGSKHLEILRETANACWINSICFFKRHSAPRPQSDFSVGFKDEAFSQEQRRKLEPFIGDPLRDSSFIAATCNMYLPFLTSEVKCGASALDIADRQNAYSQSTALCGLVELFRLVCREIELHREICGFSISHDDKDVRIWGHYPVLMEKSFEFYRYAIAKFNISPTAEGDQRWKAYTFVRNVYDLWLPEHFQRICSVVDMLPSEWNLTVTDAELDSARSGLSQQLGDYNIIDKRVIPDSQPTTQLVTPENTVQDEPSRKKNK